MYQNVSKCIKHEFSFRIIFTLACFAPFYLNGAIGNTSCFVSLLIYFLQFLIYRATTPSPTNLHAGAEKFTPMYTSASDDNICLAQSMLAKSHYTIWSHRCCINVYYIGYNQQSLLMTLWNFSSSPWVRATPPSGIDCVGHFAPALGIVMMFHIDLM